MGDIGQMSELQMGSLEGEDFKSAPFCPKNSDELRDAVKGIRNDAVTAFEKADEEGLEVAYGRLNFVKSCYSDQVMENQNYETEDGDSISLFHEWDWVELVYQSYKGVKLVQEQEQLGIDIKASAAPIFISAKICVTDADCKEHIKPSFLKFLDASGDDSKVAEIYLDIIFKDGMAKGTQRDSMGQIFGTDVLRSDLDLPETIDVLLDGQVRDSKEKECAVVQLSEAYKEYPATPTYVCGIDAIKDYFLANKPSPVSRARGVSSNNLEFSNRIVHTSIDGVGAGLLAFAGLQLGMALNARNEFLTTIDKDILESSYNATNRGVSLSIGFGIGGAGVLLGHRVERIVSRKEK